MMIVPFVWFRKPISRNGNDYGRKSEKKPYRNLTGNLQKPYSVARFRTEPNLRTASKPLFYGHPRGSVPTNSRELAKKTVWETISDARLAAVKRLLRTTTRSIGEITRQTGFKDANNLKRLFKSKTGLSMREWRKSEKPS